MAKYQTICRRETFGSTELAILQLAETGGDLPYFGQIWGSSRWLTHVLTKMDDLKGKKTLEIGCGLAIPSLFAAANWAQCVAIDIHEDTEEFILQNIKQNNLTGRIKYLQTDWKQFDPKLGTYDVIMASDVLYEKGQAESLAEFLGLALTDKNFAIIVDPCRDHVDRFVEIMRDRKFDTQRLNQHTNGRKFAEIRIEKPKTI